MVEEKNDLIRFRYETDDDNKMDLSVFVESLNGISDGYKTFLSKTEYKDIPQSLKIVEIRHKCIEIDLLSRKFNFLLKFLKSSVLSKSCLRC